MAKGAKYSSQPVRFGIMDISMVKDPDKDDDDEPPKKVRKLQNRLMIAGLAVASFVLGAATMPGMRFNNAPSTNTAPPAVTQPATPSSAAPPAPSNSPAASGTNNVRQGKPVVTQTVAFQTIQDALTYLNKHQEALKSFTLLEMKEGNLRGSLYFQPETSKQHRVDFLLNLSQPEYQDLMTAMNKLKIQPQLLTTGPGAGSTSSDIGIDPIQIIFIVLMLAMVVGMLRNGSLSRKAMQGPTNNKSFETKLKPEHPTFTLNDVAGLPTNTRKAIQNKVITVLKRLKGKKPSVLGEKLPRGLLLEGPPGTGKTLLANAIAGETGLPLFKFSGSEFEEALVGVGASRMRQAFKAVKDYAKEHNVPVILFFDELDALAKDRDNPLSNHTQLTLNQFLTEMSDPSLHNKVFVIAATNKRNMLDSAAIRAGRFDIKLRVDPPRRPEHRAEILKVHLRRITKALELTEDKTLLKIANLMFHGITGADIEQIVNEAALLASTQGKTEVNADDLKVAMVAKNFGVDDVDTKELKQYQTFKKQLAAHEWGHALMNYVFGHKIPIITVIPRDIEGLSAMGAVGRDPDDTPSLFMSYEMLMKELYILMAGRAVEEALYTPSGISTGASNDFQRVNGMIRSNLLGGGQLFAKEFQLGFLQDMKMPGAYGQSLLSDKTREMADAFANQKMNDLYQRLVRFIHSIPEEVRETMISAVMARETMDDPEEINRMFAECGADLKQLWETSNTSPALKENPTAS